jgi:hypothetical protein
VNTMVVRNALKAPHDFASHMVVVAGALTLAATKVLAISFFAPPMVAGSAADLMDATSRLWEVRVSALLMEVVVDAV